ncbi:flagellar hook-associated protein 3 [Achromobacter xylosoxidans]|jgi:flagellar hook-associated protein 3 FlgL|uniref:flagellar hook-associated protein FlgL n=1 Tax=Alcaligenes xylosoxydans xylosoxydans TaxID=85698 RepID=UPI0006C46012|nr:flagellar hook-associated protein FlgL [Achromobacter xylosoxidans]OMG79026.1 flagellar hook-associated protein 3 [Achromobacter xylosoxidans]QQE58047.1 flagellar hook-associated protein FlgL [Achromobacter xylosoxidans]QQV11796.1 flagellar hook-associated protein FlgL [Achromobacter xylosoxidans]UXL07649.1 flagellar hook-associated protein FlgL [Achromobacter xylosoxidans]CUJ45038.1 Hook-filament junction protein [Achromobacter xylosoxidans]
MRLSTSMMYSNGLKGVLAQESDMNRLVEQVGSGKKFLTPADDPLSASLAINVAQTQSMNSTYQLNRNTAKTNLGQENNVLDSITTALADVRTRVVQAGNGTFADSDRQALSTALKNARDALLGLANSTDGNGQYLFSGYQGGVVPYSQDTNGKIVYSGATGERTVQVDQSRQMSTSDIGSDIFNRANPGSQAYVSTAAQANTGTAQFSTVSVTPGSPNIGKDFRLQFESDPTTGNMGYRVITTDPNANPPVPPVTTPAPPAAPTVYTPDAAIDFGGVSVVIKGTPQNGDVIDVQSVQSADVDMFNTLDSLIKTLDSPIAGDPVALAKLNNELATANKKLSTNYDNVQTVAASVGARMNELDALDATGTQKGLSYSKSLSDLEDLDYYSGASQLALRQVALQAASAAFMTIQGSSLFSRK